MALTARQGRQILRLKGVIAFPGQERRYVVQGVHMRLDGGYQRDWKAGEARTSRMVFIGRHLDPSALRLGFDACVAHPRWWERLWRSDREPRPSEAARG